MEENQKLLEQRVELLEKEVDELKRQLHMSVTRPREKEPIKSEHKEIKSIKVESMQQTLKKEEVEKDDLDLEKLIFQKWLPRVYILIFLAGIMWGFKAASDFGILNHAAKVGIGFLVAILLLWIGNRQIKSGRNMLGQVCIGAVLPVLMLTTYAMHNLYDYIGPSFAFFLHVCWITLGLFLTDRYRSEPVGILSCIGGVLIPFLIESSHPNTLFFIGYETLLYLVFLAYSTWRTHKILYLTSSILLNLVLVIPFIQKGYHYEFFKYASFAVILQHLGLLVIFLRSKISLKWQMGVLNTSLLIVICWCMRTFKENTITIFFLLISALYVYLVVRYKTNKERFFLSTTNLILGITFLAINVLSYDLLRLFLLVQSFIAYLFYIKYKDYIKLVFCFLTAVPVALLIITSPIEAIISYKTITFIALIFYVCAFTYVTIKNSKEDEESLVLNLGSLITMVLVLVFVTEISSVISKGWSDTASRIVMNISWLIVAIGTILLGVLKKIKLWYYLGTGVIVLVFIKFVLIDIPNVSLIVRAGLFILVGLIGLLISRFVFKEK
ncbi:DUF2339 domain-containing protein [Bacillus sp. RG28]|uniref:DUF2339 domain-containing protein n=1 Tax=Gottfriedia endophytica TaxID=2820819 RepID=A0A940NNH3_9BACI|nr:DUF2339 domain-containing protein [Gottfriedia endophytica]MBP0723956.1 DUF2339 domain-containing protein [Gottfriedia endophytica]